ncbi:hypothetical protein GCM10007415_10320 [Parapedobacter pyrenivorans]|uniref:PD-(D/E)XK nuclease family transposase n=2 Tax=Parapedobacter pyrenivorans TaxID=1305674 RepID=A0A917HIV1_9SPHI|nr:hypothetical protein GCM10007415_10320 [Parapedobacter pyrenivorans]
MHIVDLEYAPNEHDGDEDKRVVFDLHCRGDNGEYFIVEMQRIRQDFFKDRALYYVSRLIQRLLKKGKASNDYQLPEVYLIGILEFNMDAVSLKVIPHPSVARRYRRSSGIVCL